jgi:hypothetical protein
MRERGEGGTFLGSSLFAVISNLVRSSFCLRVSPSSSVPKFATSCKTLLLISERGRERRLIHLPLLV